MKTINEIRQGIRLCIAEGFFNNDTSDKIADDILSIEIGGEVECNHKSWLYDDAGRPIYGRFADNCPECHGSGKLRPRTIRDAIGGEKW